MQAKNARVHRLVAVGIVLVMCLGLALTGVAQAIPVTFQFGGIIQSASPNLNLNLPVSPPTPISGSYTFQSDTPDFNSVSTDTSLGLYALSNFSVTFLSRTYSIATHTRPNYIQVESNGFNDAYRVLLIPQGVEQAITGPAINGLVPRSFQINITGNMFTSDALPLVPPSISSLPPSQRRFDMSFLGGGGVSGVINSLTLAPVPLPGALLLFGSGLLGLAGLGIHRRLRS